MRKLLVLFTLSPALLLAQPKLDEGIRLQKERKYEEARAAFEAVLKSDASNLEANIRLSELYAQRFDDIDKAIEHGLAAVKKDDHSSRAHVKLGAAYGIAGMRAGMLKGFSLAKKVKAELERAVSVDPKDLDAREQLFWFYLQVPGIAGGDVEKARALAEETLAVDEATGRQLRARVLRKKNDSAAAEVEYRKALAVAPERVPVLNEVGYFYVEGKRHDEARALFEKALELAPENPNAHDSLADAFAAAGHLDDAIREYRKALELDPGYIASLYRLGEAYEKKGDKAEAVKCYERCASLRPLTRWAKLSKKKLKELA